MSTQSRRDFLRKTAIGAGATSLGPLFAGGCGLAPDSSESVEDAPGGEENRPVVISTWKHGLAANKAAWQMLEIGKSALDAAEAGVRISEADPQVSSVGYGGRPDREGHVTLDACVMNSRGKCGSVAFLEHIVHPVSVARLVMEKTPHVMLVGSGALKFALESGFEKTNLLTDESEAHWQKWKKTSVYAPMQHSSQHDTSQHDTSQHDTIGMLTLDQNGDLSGACTTSGLAYKMHGRVGDSPIIGAALFVDNEIGAACATGIGELVMQTVGSFLVVELMRQGATPQQACEAALRRITDKNLANSADQVGYLALNKKGQIGAAGLREGFEYAAHTAERNVLNKAQSLRARPEISRGV